MTESAVRPWVNEIEQRLALARQGAHYPRNDALDDIARLCAYVRQLQGALLAYRGSPS